MQATVRSVITICAFHDWCEHGEVRRGVANRNYRQRRKRESCVYLVDLKRKEKNLNLDRICTIKLRGNLAFSDFLAECLKQQSRTQF